MTTHTQIGTFVRKSSIAALAVLVLAGTASAQDTFEIKIKRTSDANVEASYADMRDQAKKHCKRTLRINKDRLTPQKAKSIYVSKCVDEIMSNVVSQLQDSELAAFHRAKTSGTISSAARTATD